MSTLATTAARGAALDVRALRWQIRRSADIAFPLAIAVALLIANLVSESGGFGFTQQAADAAPLALAALASAPSIIGGGLDLSISPLMFFVNSVFIVWLAPHGFGAYGIPIMLALGAGVGTATGLLILFLRVDAIVVTLAMFFILQGADLLIAPLPVSAPLGGMSDLANSAGPIPGGVITMLFPLGVWAALRLTPFRRYLYALGSNQATAFSSGVDIASIRVLSYGLGGLFAGAGGVALTALVQSATAANATEYTLAAVAGVTLGGISLAGGRGRLAGALVGGLAIYLLQNLLASFQINPAYLQVVYGVMLVIAVLVSGVAIAGRSGPGRRRRTLSLSLPRWRRREHAERVRFDITSAVEIGDRDDAAVAEPRTEDRHTLWGKLVALQRRFPLAQCLVLFAIFMYGQQTLDGFGSWSSIRIILLIAALTGLASAGQTILILMGGFDLSVAGFIVAGALTTTALGAKYHMPFAEALLVAVVGAAILGGAAGYICHRLSIQPLVVTLAIGSIAVGLVQVQTTSLTGVPPQWLSNVAEPAAKTFGLGIPPVVVIWILFAVVLAVFLHRTVAGRHLMATGANLRAADYALIRTRRIWTAGFAFSAVTSVLVGVLLAGYAGGVDASMGDPYLFQSVVAVVVGGTIFGGPGDYTRTTIGALLLTVLTTVLVGHGAGTATEDIVDGAVILLAIAAYGRRGRVGALV